MTLAHRLRSSLLDRLVPPIRIDDAGGIAYVAYYTHKTTLIEGRAACPLLDPLIRQRRAHRYTHILLGRVSRQETVPSNQVPRSLKWLEFGCSLLFWERHDVTDYRFITRLLTLQLCTPKRHRRLHALRSFLLARYFALKFRNIASACDCAYVICYYDAIMLGVVRAFRRLGKPVWDVQHGHLGATHDAYNNSNAYSIGSNFQPTGFVVWDKSFGEYLEATLGARWESTEYLHLRAVPQAAVRDTKPTILYSLQWDTLPAQEVLAAVRHFSNAQWIFRLHPYQRRPPPELDVLRSLPNASLVDSSEPLATALLRCDLHLTHNSSVVHEAAALGKPSLFLDPQLVQRFAPEIDKGLAGFVRLGELTDALDKFLETRTSTSPREAPTKRGTAERL